MDRYVKNQVEIENYHWKLVRFGILSEKNYLKYKNIPNGYTMFLAWFKTGKHLPSLYARKITGKKCNFEDVKRQAFGSFFYGRSSKNKILEST